MLRCLAVLGFVLAVVLAAPPVRAAEPTSLEDLASRFYSELFALTPTTATYVGVHDYDRALEDFSPAGVARHVQLLRSWDTRFAALAGRVSGSDAVDLELIRGAIGSGLLELERLAAWRHDAGFYPEAASDSVYSIIKRDFAPAAERMESVIAREEKIPELLEQGRKNLVDVPRVKIEIALDQIEGIVGFFKGDVTLAFAEVKDAALQARLTRSTAAVASALEQYGVFLRKTLLPTARASFAIGPELYTAMLHHEQMIDTPLDELLARGEKELRRLQAEFKVTAARIDAKHPAPEVFVRITRDHPPANRVIPETDAGLKALRDFIVAKNIAGMPTEPPPRVQETPPFMRATTLASMSVPGPLETKATESYYSVTLPDPRWSPERADEFLRAEFSRPLLQVVSIHEAYPGHYLQLIQIPKLKTLIRRLESTTTSNAEGWAHYCEQMMLEEGWGQGNPTIKLAQLHDALLRAARYVAAIRMHTKGMTVAESEAFFQREGLQSPDVARIEARRGTRDPTYLVYTLGKLEFLRLRDDYKKKMGRAYSLRGFHDAVLREGVIPLPLLRRILLGNQ